MNKTEKRSRRHKRVRSKISGTALRPRLSVFRSNRTLYAQLIDDDTRTTLFSAKTDNIGKETLTKKAHTIGKKLAVEAKGKGITKVVFDRGGFIYTGNIKSFAEGVREGGISF